MTDVKIYTITSDDLSPPIKGEGFCTDMVRHSDYAALEERLNQMAAENAALKTPAHWLAAADIGDQAAENAALTGANDDEQLLAGMVAIMESITTPTTDAWQREQMAKGVDAAIECAKNVVAQEFQYKDFDTAQRVCCQFPESDLVGKVEMVEWMADFAAQLRNGEAV